MCFGSGIDHNGNVFYFFQCGDFEERMMRHAEVQHEADRREYEMDQAGESAIDHDLLVDEYLEYADEEDTLDQYDEEHRRTGEDEDEDDEGYSLFSEYDSDEDLFDEVEAIREHCDT